MATQVGTIPVTSDKKEQMNGIEPAMITCQEISLQVMYQNMDMLFFMKDPSVSFYALKTYDEIQILFQMHTAV